MIRRIAVALLFTAPVFAQQASPATVLDAKTLHVTGDELLEKARTSPDGIAFKVLLTRPDGNEQLAVRTKSGQGEWHHDYIDIFYIVQGKGELITGGKIVNGKETMPGEVRGDGVAGGTKQAIQAGDVVRIEPQVPHQMIIPAGSDFRYFVVKIKK